MAMHVVRLLAREEIARETIALHFERPESFEFKPGQYVSLRLIDPPETDDEGNSRYFSITTAPHEPNLTFATRVRNTAMKRVLNSTPLGTEVKITGPFGAFTLDADATRPVVFIAGGIGITPFRSMVVHAAHERLPHRIWLFYSNRTPEDAAFLQELQSLEAPGPELQAGSGDD
ncbi:MAG: FAD-dependent oxidoreductase [Blastocatellia bacterium]